MYIPGIHPVYHPGYTSPPTIPATVQAPRHRACPFTALAQGVTERCVSDGSLTVTRVTVTRFTVGRIQEFTEGFIPEEEGYFQFGIIRG